MVVLMTQLTSRLPKAHFGWNEILEWNCSISLDPCFQLDTPDGCAPSQVRGTAKAVEFHLKVGSQFSTFKLKAAAKVTSFPTASWFEAICEPSEVVCC